MLLSCCRIVWVWSARLSEDNGWVGDLQRVRWCDLHPRTANNFHGTVMSRLKFTELHATVHRVSTSDCCCYIAVKLSWKTQKLDGCGLGSSTRLSQGRPSTAPQWTRGREQWGHVSTWPARGHNCVISTQRWTPACLGWPVSYIIFYWGGQCGNTSPHPSPRPVPGGTCWLQNPRSGRCNTRYTRCQQPSCFYKRLSRIKWRVEVSVWFPW